MQCDSVSICGMQLNQDQYVRNAVNNVSSFIPQELARHPAIRTMLDYKWKHYARKLFM